MTTVAAIVIAAVVWCWGYRHGRRDALQEFADSREISWFGEEI
ncbi:MAG: hypothetical protein PHV34_05945 [Verrucomicrobiae bacterium]|nr:hypothetical protein [Verrucomicrobiae bacterium]